MCMTSRDLKWVTFEHTEPKYYCVCIYYNVQSVTLHPHFSGLSICLEDVLLVLVATGLRARTTRGSDLLTVIGAVGDSSGLKCRWYLFLLTTPEGVCTSYDQSVVLCTIVPGKGFVPALVTTNTGSSFLKIYCSISLVKVTLLSLLKLFIWIMEILKN